MCQQQPREFSLSCRQHLLAPRPQQRRPRRAQPPAPQWELPSSGTTHMGILRPAATRSLGAHMGPARAQLENAPPRKWLSRRRGRFGLFLSHKRPSIA